MNYLIKKLSTPLIDDNNFSKKLSYLYLLPFIAKLKYEKALKIAEIRGKYISEKYKKFFNESKENIKNILEINEENAKILIENMFKKSSIEELEASLLGNKNKNFLEKYVEILNLNNFKKSLNYKKGIILTIIHVGSFASALCKTALIFNNIRFNAISWDYKTSECEITKKFIKNKIEGMNHFFRGEFFYVGRINPKKLYNKLNNKEVLIIAVDSPLGKSKFVEINFLKKQIKFPYTAVKLAHRTSSLIIPLAVYRDEIKIIGEFYEPIEVKNDDYQFYMQQIFSTLEMNIYKHPDEFFYWTSPTSWRTIGQL